MNPKKIMPSPSLQCLKSQRLNVMNKFSSSMSKASSCIGLDSKDRKEGEDEPEQKSELERRTVDAKRISTVSSLVATKSESEDGNKSSKGKESQRNNFGLYALKFQRNLTNHANNMIMSFRNDNCVRSKVTKLETMHADTESPKLEPMSSRLKHEYFEPCERADEFTLSNYEREPKEGDSYEVWNKPDQNANRANRTWRMSSGVKCNKPENDNSEDTVDEPSIRAPARPKRIKPLAPKINSIIAHDVANRPNHPIKHQYMDYESTQSMDNFDSDPNVLMI